MKGHRMRRLPSFIHGKLPIAAFAAGFLVATAVSVLAQPRYRDRAPESVVAESHYGHGRAIGAVRPGGRGGWQVRLPGGTWVDCGRSCTDTLRRQSVDLWENIGKDGPDQGRGYLSRSWGF